jgi:hypothetical protein
LDFNYRVDSAANGYNELEVINTVNGFAGKRSAEP